MDELLHKAFPHDFRSELTKPQWAKKTKASKPELKVRTKVKASDMALGRDAATALVLPAAEGKEPQEQQEGDCGRVQEGDVRAFTWSEEEHDQALYKQGKGPLARAEARRGSWIEGVFAESHVRFAAGRSAPEPAARRALARRSGGGGGAPRGSG